MPPRRRHARSKPKPQPRATPTKELDVSSSHSLLLNLPRELRDIIYRYVLSYDGGLHVEVSSNTPWSSSQLKISGRRTRNLLQKPVNILEFVCKQLWEETRGLIFTTNDQIALFGTSYVSPSSFTFNLFVNQLSIKTLRNHLRKICVHGSPGIDPVTRCPVSWKELPVFATGFRSFCEQYTQILVILQFPKVFDVDSDRWYHWAGALQKVLRGSSPLIIPAYQGHFAAQLAQLHVAFAHMPPLPYNLRFSIIDMYPEENVENELEYYRDMSLLSRQQTDLVREETKNLFHNGF